MPDVDPAVAYRTLTARAAALRAEADAARKQSVVADQEDAGRFGLRRDELDRDRGTLARDAELADAQVKELETDRDASIARAKSYEADIAAGKMVDQGATVWRREAEEARAAAEQLGDRADAARVDAAATRERLATVDRQLVELDNEVRDAGAENDAGRLAIYALDDQAIYTAEAARRYGEAAAAGDDVPERATKELAAEQALQQAGAIVVDRDAIRRVVPGLPERTPGLEEHPWPPAAPTIGPEETLDPFDGEADASAAADPGSAATDATALTDTFDDTADDDVSTSRADGTTGDDPAWLDPEAAQLAVEGSAAIDGSGFDTPAPAAETFAPSSTLSAEGGMESDPVASSADSPDGYEDALASPESGDAFAPETTDGYDDAATAFADPAAGYADDYSSDASADYSADNGGGGDDYASASADTGYDDGSVG